ncbi:MAG: hypothetical protein ACLQVI_43960 [Polyangiaceae bacterium]|jgi:hypothetical protein
MLRRTLSVTLATFLMAPVACGGVSQDPPGAQGGGDGGGSSGGGSSGGSSSGASGTSSGSTSDDSGTSGSSSGGSSSGSSSGGGTITDSGTVEAGGGCTSSAECEGTDVCCLGGGKGGGGGGGGAKGSCTATCNGLTLCSGPGTCPNGETCETFGPIMGCRAGDGGNFTPPDGGFPHGPDAG